MEMRRENVYILQIKSLQFVEIKIAYINGFSLPRSTVDEHGPKKKKLKFIKKSLHAKEVH